MIRFFSDKPCKTEMETHRQNYRMAFDAMRAYHQSEIDHKKDAISVLNNILITMLTVFGGIYYLIFTTSIPLKNGVIFSITLLIALSYLLIITAIKRKIFAKISADNLRYEKFREECIVE